MTEAFHDEWGRVVATLIGMTGDWDLAEECAQEASAQALDSWPGDGVPRRPGAWLTTVARNRALDRLRRRTNEKTKLAQVAVLSRGAGDAEEMDQVYDDSGVPLATWAFQRRAPSRCIRTPASLVTARNRWMDSSGCTVPPPKL